MFLDSVFQLKQQIVTHVRDSIKLVPVVTRKPRVWRHWLLSAHKEQIILVVLLALVIFIITPFIDLFLSEIFSPVTRETLFGLIKTTQENPRLDDFQMASRWLIWMSTVVFVVYLFLRHIPGSLKAAQDIAKEKEQQADQLVDINPSESILLYDAAREWSWNEQSESELNTKLAKLNVKMSGARENTANIPIEPEKAGGTVILTTSDEKKAKKAIIDARYQLKEELGSGAMGIVYLAEDLRLSRDVALKQLSPSFTADEHLRARFRQEALALARLSHPNIVHVYDFFEWNNLFLIAMELVEGEELEQKLNTSQLLQQAEVIKLTKQMAEGLGYAHERGVVHRDFKPANILITKSGQVKITDFGIAKLAQSSLHTQINTIMGSPAYMSPEQANGDDTDQRADIYALGIVLYQMLCGERPFNGDTKSIIAQHLTKIPANLNEKRSDISPALNDLWMKLSRY
jgi:hypothetical protein